MARVQIIFLLSTLAVLIFFQGMVSCAELNYVGPEKCMECHRTYYDSWKRTSHSKVLMSAEEASQAGLHEPPPPYTWNDVAYTIGVKHRTLYVNRTGYFITDSNGKPGQNQWNVETKRWADFEPGKIKQFDCAPCHTTGYTSDFHQKNMPGVNGTWIFEGVTCERCHGPGGKHVVSANKSDIQRVRYSELCGQCHMVDAREKIPARDGLIQYHEEFNA